MSVSFVPDLVLDRRRAYHRVCVVQVPHQATLFFMAMVDELQMPP
jgi:hypothetical protein